MPWLPCAGYNRTSDLPMPVKPAPVTPPQVLLPEQSLVDSLFQLPPLRDLPFRALLKAGFKLALLFLLFFALNTALRVLIGRASDRFAARRGAAMNPTQAARLRTLATLGQSASYYTLLFLFVVGALGVLGVNVLGLVGTAGVAGIAIGFGAQKMVKDVFSGFFILLEDQFGVGEYVTAGGNGIAGGGVTGTVEELGMRSTRIRDDDGKLYILSNGDITQVCNYSRGTVAHSFEIGVAATVDITAATHLLNDALASASETLALAEPAHVAGVSATDGLKTTLKISFRTVVPTDAKRPADMILALREAGRAALIAAGIALA